MSQLSSVDRLGARGAKVVDEVRTEQGAVEAARHRLQTRTPRTRRRWMPAALVAALVAATAILGLYFVQRSEPITCRVVGVDAPVVAVDKPIRARAERKAVIEFSDGSSVAVAADSQARVMAVDDHGARVRLEHGDCHVNIAPRVDAAWQIHAGDLMVAVTGTRFDVQWQPDEQQLRVEAREGVPTTGHVVVCATWAFDRVLGLRGFGFLPVLPAELDGPEGRAEIEPTLLGASLVFDSGEGLLRPAAGAGLAVVHFDAKGEAAESFRGQQDATVAALTFASVGVGADPSDGLRLGGDVMLGTALRRAQVVFDERNAATWGAVVVGLSIGVEARLF